MKTLNDYNTFINESNIDIANSYIKDLTKMKKTINSCKTEEQTRSADNAFELWKKKWAKLRSQIRNYDFNTDIEDLNDLLNKKYKDK